MDSIAKYNNIIYYYRKQENSEVYLMADIRAKYDTIIWWRCPIISFSSDINDIENTYIVGIVLYDLLARVKR